MDLVIVHVICSNLVIRCIHSSLFLPAKFNRLFSATTYYPCAFGSSLLLVRYSVSLSRPFISNRALERLAFVPVGHTYYII